MTEAPSLLDHDILNEQGKQPRIADTLAVVLPHRGKFDDLPKQVKEAFRQPSLRDDYWIAHIKGGSSAAVFNYDSLWCTALNERIGGGVTHLAMLHDDVFVPMGWVDTLRREMDRLDLDLISCVIPIRGTDSGITSTAVETGNLYSPRRYTMHEVCKKPTTWSEPGLLLNTGCMLLRFTAPCFEGFSFKMYNRIVQVWSPQQQRMLWRPEMRSEDWEMSRYVTERGGKIAATRALQLYHGTPDCHNHYAWGTWEHEQMGEGAKLAMNEPASA